MAEPKIGAFICHCGGNISDYVDVEKVREAAEKEPGVVVARTSMFTCSDATQQEIIKTIKENQLDGIVIASCSPKLHLLTFREMAKRAGLNPYKYTQVNIREQVSWAHTHDRDAATRKAATLVRAGIAQTRLGRPLETIRVDTVPRVLVVGGGVAGMRAALALSDTGIEAHLVERESALGGQVASWGRLFPNNRSGREIVQALVKRVEESPRVHVYTGARVVEKQGSVGDLSVKVETNGGEPVELRVGAVVVATGFERYRPGEGEFGYGLPGVVTLDEFRNLIDGAGQDGLIYQGRRVSTIAYIYCVGSRQRTGEQGAHTYCSRYCCTAAVHTSLLAGDLDPSLRQYHLYRDMRTYGQHEMLFDQALRGGTLFLKFADDDPPVVSAGGAGLTVGVNDQLTSGERIEIDADLVVLVNGMVAPENTDLVDVLKLPIGRDGFFNEIHPKLRPVETVLDGILIAGACQGPKNLPESMASSMAAAAKGAALLKKGYIDLEPFVATVDAETCTWCGDCADACPYGAIGKTESGGKSIAAINTVLCKGCGACVPVCEPQALSVLGYTHEQITSAIDALAEEVAS